MTLARIHKCCSYSLVGVVIGYAIAFSEGYAIAQTVCLPGQECRRPLLIPPSHPPNLWTKRPIWILLELYPEAIQQLQQEDPQAIQKLIDDDLETVQKLQILVPNLSQQLQELDTANVIQQQLFSP
ncbi:hypothetical protein [Iningainema tapete]|uniref:Uncharacterized protein n=1 Tax=Iningainema tapete BLCC-T55 TaxID=2748662 RepID=A0A8J6XSB8_9CYAN|nr:hypothetical protein [Iningainema tapete]MBD2775687.1 hypothetical protein [Iningainema tapete BLCC-T55]